MYQTYEEISDSRDMSCETPDMHGSHGRSSQLFREFSSKVIFVSPLLPGELDSNRQPSIRSPQSDVTLRLLSIFVAI
ncbi:hypothetical protein T10_11492 [Trichinella papuae]|uniref:Uncharacterized protein n=1 Tax=Trichinella papuae TaxID=268474 RepID=A0A0V1NA93_9BILA|nr:hypothetical protein T10_11492 [Trichinella papuae]